MGNAIETRTRKGTCNVQGLALIVTSLWFAEFEFLRQCIDCMIQGTLTDI